MTDKLNTEYRAEIDGLRALAVLPVISFHAGFDIFSGGFVGVDIFFVISGYLITTIIIKDLDNNTFSFKKFYERRARRIFPALIFVILISSIISFIFLTRSELASYFKSVVATLLFFSNFYFYKTTPYFRSESDLEPLLHTWSLSIEEQFYIIFPITLLLFHKFFKRYIFLMLIFGFVASLFICQFLALKTGGTLNFYFTFSRAWELALGAVCAHILIYKNLSYTTLIKNLLSTIGIILIVFSIFFFSRQTVFPSFYTLVPTIGTSLIILFADKYTFINKILSIKFLVGIGLISYSLYLWHQPLLAFGRIFFDDLSIINKFTLIFLSILMSIFSYFFIEKIFRDKNKINFKIFFRTGYITSILLILFSYTSYDFFSSKNSTEALLAKLLLDNNAVYSTKMDERKFIKNRIIYENLKTTVLVIGSSRIMQISNDNFNKQILNLGVSGASVEDHIAITLMALEKFNVDTILLSADPWLFNDFANQLRWKSISEEYKNSLKSIQFKSKDYNIIENKNDRKTYFFYERFLEKLYGFLNIRKLDLTIKENQINNLSKDAILRDGKRVYANKEIKEKIKANVIGYSMYQYKFSDEYYKIYKSFIEHLTNVHNKEVILVLPPYYLPSYKLTIQEKPFYLDLENKFKELSKATKIKIIGSYDASSVSCYDYEFYDNLHAKDSCMKKITNSIN
jgi:peptidoglycan/LPS O-acetylase OafA/YrhL